MTIESTSTQAKLLARFLREKGLATLTHSQALEALAHAQNLKSHNVLAAQSKAAIDTAAPSVHEQAMALLRQAIALGLNVGDALTTFAESRTPVELMYLETARGLGSEGELEFDDNACVSLGDDKGAYVMSWSWVSLGDIPMPDNATLSLSMNYESIGLDIGEEEYRQIPITDLELNDEALESLQNGKNQPADTWLVRSKKADKAKPFELTVADFNTLKLNKKGDCYEGTTKGIPLFLEFFAT
jgi:hypothetical protein